MNLKRSEALLKDESRAEEVEKGWLEAGTTVDESREAHDANATKEVGARSALETLRPIAAEAERLELSTKAELEAAQRQMEEEEMLLVKARAALDAEVNKQKAEETAILDQAMRGSSKSPMESAARAAARALLEIAPQGT